MSFIDISPPFSDLRNANTIQSVNFHNTLFVNAMHYGMILMLLPAIIKLFDMAKTPQISFIEFMPVSIFGSVMGLCGLSFAWRYAAAFWKITELPSLIFGYIAIVSFVALVICYLYKFVKYTSLVLLEFRSPASVCFFATIIICFLLLPGVLLPINVLIATIMWCLGAILMLLFAWYIVRAWIDQRQEPENSMPAWVLPVVGTLDIPIIGHSLSLPGIHEISTLAFGIGSLSSLILLTIIISRLIFQEPLPKVLQPSLMILTTPLALAFTVYHQLTGKYDMVTGALFYFNIFLLLVLGSKVVLVTVSCPFKVTWWAISFPLSAVTISALIYCQHKPDTFHQVFAISLLALITVLVIYLVAMTILKISMRTFA